MLARIGIADFTSVAIQFFFPLLFVFLLTALTADNRGFAATSGPA
jgi:hypothetical protein